MTSASSIVFTVVVVAALGFFSYNVQRLVGELRLGHRDDVRWNDLPRRFWNLLQIGLFQKKIFRDSIAGPMHAAIFWGFCVLTIGTTEMIAAGMFPGFSFAPFVPAPVYAFYEMNQDLWGALVIAAVSFALFRRLTKRVKRLQGKETHADDPLLILSWIGVLMITMFASHATTGVLHDLFWWSHALLVLGFLNYLPYSKHLHVVVSLPNVFLSNTSGPGVIGAMRPMDLEGDVAVFGAKDVTNLSWKSLLDGFACTECGRCTSVCPANITGKLLNPRKIVITVRERLEAEAKGDHSKHLLDDYITEEELWSCTTCRASAIKPSSGTAIPRITISGGFSSRPVRLLIWIIGSTIPSSLRCFRSRITRSSTTSLAFPPESMQTRPTVTLPVFVAEFLSSSRTSPSSSRIVFSTTPISPASSTCRFRWR